LGVWGVRTPADLALAVLFLLLPMAVWVAPSPLRDLYAYPRALILLWNLALFWWLTVHCGRSAPLRTLCAGGFVAVGTAIALAGLFGTRWDVKSPLLSAALDRLPKFLVGVFAGAQEGFSPNQLAGTLLYVLPFAAAWLLFVLYRRQAGATLLLAAAAGLMLLVTLISQSRAGLAGLAAAGIILVLCPWRWGRRLLGAGLFLAAAVLMLIPSTSLLVQVDNLTKAQGVYGSLSIAGRLEIWSRAIPAFADFFFTGVGLGAFRGVVQQLYPLYLFPADLDIAHAHNFFLQSGLDFGVFGLAALLALYLLASVQCLHLWRTPLFEGHRAWALGLFAALGGQAVYSMADAVAMGSKTNLLFWWLLALIFGLTAAWPRPARSLVAPLVTPKG
jgi:O-antigen ligase